MADERVSEWLTGVGLAHYAELFAANKIGRDVLSDLTERDLQDLGIPLGDRKRLLKAIAGTMPVPAAPPPGAAAPHADAERRQLTVMFCDLVGSTALSQQLDPEALRELMRAYQQACGTVIEKYDGHVAQYLGDGLMVYFGWPRAHEDDAERAIRAALEIVVAVKHVQAPEPLQVRVGIATGPVVVGETGAGDASVPKVAVGETPNLAARLQGPAGADEIVIAPTTHRLVGAAFQYADLGRHTLKGIVEPVQAWRVTGLGRSEGRFEAVHAAGGLTTFVGREQEIALLLARWEQACEGEGQVVLLSGEAGIGKSRITQVLRERLAAQAHTRLRYQCSPYHTGSALYPIIEQLERAAGFERDDSPDTRLDKLEAVLAAPPEDLPAVAPLIAALLSLPIARYPPRVLSPQKQKELTIAALVDQALHLSRREPLLIVLEDAHWVDPTTLEAFALMVERIREAAILLLVTYRPEFVPPWSGHSHVTTFNLNRLPRRYATAIVHKVTRGKILPEPVLEQILAKTDGVPLFVEELTKTVLEAGFLKEAGERYVLEGPLPPLAIPSTLRDSLMARLDRLSPVKEVAQVAACIGREFSYELLAAISSLPDAALQDALQQLMDSELIFGRGRPPEASYSFKHALVQDSAYESLLNSRRQQVHRQIARTLEERFADVVKAQPELLALHLTKAGLWDEAVPRWLAAAQLASAGNRNREALSHVDAGLAIVDVVSEDRREDLRAALLVTGIFGHIALGGYGSTSVAELLARVEPLIDQIKDQDVLFSALWAIGSHAWVRADFVKGVATFARVAALADDAGDIDRRVFGSQLLGSILVNVGQPERARTRLKFALEHYRVERHLPYVYVFGHDSKVISCGWMALLNATSGEFQQARHHAAMAVDHGTEIRHAFSRAQALAMATLAMVELGDVDQTDRWASECIQLCETQSIPFWQGLAMVSEGVALLHRGAYAQAAERLEQGDMHLSALGSDSEKGFIRGWRALALAHEGRFTQARHNADDAREITLRTGELMYLALTAYARGMTDLLDPAADNQAAEHWLSTALSEARSQGQRMMELRTATAYARLLQSQARIQEAIELLQPIYGWFTEGFETKDLKEAKALLKALGG